MTSDFWLGVWVGFNAVLIAGFLIGLAREHYRRQGERNLQKAREQADKIKRRMGLRLVHGR